MEHEHKVGELVYFDSSRYDSLNRKTSLGIIIKKDDGANDLYYIQWLADDFQPIIPYSSVAINNFKRQLKLYLLGFE